MSIVNFTKNINNYKKAELLSIVDTTIGIVDNIENSLLLAKSNEINFDHLANDYAIIKSLSNALKKNGNNHLDLTFTLEVVAENTVKLLTYFKSIVKQDFPNNFSGATLSFKQANILKLIQACDFWCKYTQVLLNVLTGLLVNKKDEINDIVAKSDLNFINKTANYYVDVSIDLLKNPKEIQKEVNLLSDSTVDEVTTDILKSTGHDSQTELTQRGFGVHVLNPYYWLLEFRSNIDLKRIKIARQNMELYAARLHKYQNQKQNTEDPMIDYRINVLQDEIIKNQAKITEIEGKYARKYE